MQQMKTHSRRVFEIINLLVCIVVGFMCIAPVWHVFSVSLSSKEYIIGGKVSFLPLGFTLDNYRYVVKDNQFYTAFFISVVRTVLALLLSMTLTIMAAYPLSMSRRNFRARKYYIWLYIIPMIFNGGMIPTYLVVSNTGLIDTLWALLIPCAVSVYNVILLQNFMKRLPDAISEAAFIDGADYFQTLTSVVLPLCKPSLATIALFIAVQHWNAWYDGMIYINDNTLFPLQTYLRTIIVQLNLDQVTDLDALSQRVATIGTDSAKIFMALFPLLLVYPFAQKYFITGIVHGSVKE